MIPSLVSKICSTVRSKPEVVVKGAVTGVALTIIGSVGHTLKQAEESAPIFPLSPEDRRTLCKIIAEM